MKKYSVLPIIYVAVLVIFQAVVSFMNINSSGGLSATSAMIGTLYVAMLAIRRKSAFLIAVVFNVLTLIIGVEHQIYSELIQQPLFIIANIIGFINVTRIHKYPNLEKLLKRVHDVHILKVISFSLVIIVVWGAISYSLGSPVWWKDGMLCGIALAAQIFTTAGNKRCWYGWMLLNLISSWTWFTVATPNIIMGVLYLVFFVNSIVGYINYTRAEKGNQPTKQGTF